MLMYGTANTGLLHRVCCLATQTVDGTTGALTVNGLVADVVTKIILYQLHDQNAAPVEYASLGDPQLRIVGEPARGDAQWKLGGGGGAVVGHVVSGVGSHSPTWRVSAPGSFDHRRGSLQRERPNRPARVRRRR